MITEFRLMHISRFMIVPGFNMAVVGLDVSLWSFTGLIAAMLIYPRSIVSRGLRRPLSRTVTGLGITLVVAA